jgi:hypothetical protein
VAAVREGVTECNKTINILMKGQQKLKVKATNLVLLATERKITISKMTNDLQTLSEETTHLTLQGT